MLLEATVIALSILTCVLFLNLKRLEKKVEHHKNLHNHELTVNGRLRAHIQKLDKAIVKIKGDKKC